MRQQSTAKVLHRVSKPKRAVLEAHKDVHIISDGGQVDQNDVPISKSAGDEVSWFAYGGAGAIIEFLPPDGSPFNDSKFYVPTAGSVTSGPAKANAVVNKYYKYTVTGRAGQNDPGVIIHN
jgi:hypothetical protein